MKLEILQQDASTIRTERITRSLQALTKIWSEAIALEQKEAESLEKIYPAKRSSVQNLIHYLAVRRHDIRDLQYDLSILGLSSLGRMEAHVMASLQAVLEALYKIDNRPIPEEIQAELSITHELGNAILAQNTLEILGPKPELRNARIMVTMPSEAAEDPQIIHKLLAKDMDIMRVNCAHDNREAWTKMIDNLRQAETELGKSCRISFDLAGPKLRTGKIEGKHFSLSQGDTLVVKQGDIIGKPASKNTPAIVGCDVPEVFRDVKVGERIFFDDGVIAGVICNVETEEFQVEITLARDGKAKLKSEKGINLPDTNLKLPALTKKDLQDLEFVAQNGDMVAISFVQHPADIEQLIKELEKLNGGQLGIILKIENQKAFNQLPRLLLTALSHRQIAVMVARGDLGVEVGFERLSEVQEEILWLCEAAHVPVIWATQVLESLAKNGMASRAEVTDAAMGSRAECVMLNKGPYIDKAMQFLCDVLQRMQAHHQKKTVMLRQLNVSQF
ncbi:MAG: pyruvate kinase [Trichodesmium sp.]